LSDSFDIGLTPSSLFAAAPILCYDFSKVERNHREGAPLRACRHARYKRPRRGACAMKEAIHPDYHEITVVMTDGTSYTTRSTYGKAGDTLRLEIDSKSHPAWTGGQQRLVDSGGQLARFNKRFQGFKIK
jgi:large subunit ribosomal protein L31